MLTFLLMPASQKLCNITMYAAYVTQPCLCVLVGFFFFFFNNEHYSLTEPIVWLSQVNYREGMYEFANVNTFTCDKCVINSSQYFT